MLQNINESKRDKMAKVDYQQKDYKPKLREPIKRNPAKVMLYGESGSGKSFTSALIAQGMKEANKELNIVVISSEKGRMDSYSDIADFKIIDIITGHPDEYIQAIKLAKEEGKADIIIIDQITTAWQKQVEAVDNIKGRFKDDRMAWNQPEAKRYTALKNGISKSDLHFIVLFRAKNDSFENGDLIPEDGKKLKYEFEMQIKTIGDGEVIIERDSIFREQRNRSESIKDYEFGKKLYQRLNSEFPKKYTTKEKK